MRYLLLLISYLLTLPCMAIELPDIGNSADAAISPSEEQKLGEAFFRQIRRQAEVIDDIEVNNYINELGRQLVSYSDNPQQLFQFFVIKEDSINAFAVPGGFIGVNTGLILKTRDESELASVLAHEIAHITQRHIARTEEASQRYSLPMMAALIAALLVGGANPQIAEAAVAAVVAGSIQMQLNFTREHEKEADRVGMKILAEAGFDPHSMPAFFKRLQEANRFYENSNIPEFLRTHPVTSDRIAEAQNRADKYLVTSADDTPYYHLMKAKLLVVIERNPNQLLKNLKNMFKEGRYRDERALRYAIALAQLTTKQPAGIQEQLEWLSKNDTDRVMYRLLNAQSLWLKQQYPQAKAVYEQALQVYPGNTILGIDYAEKLLQNDSMINATIAKKVLSTLPTSVNNPYYYHLLAQAYEKIGTSVEASLALAESYYLGGQTSLAVEQLRQAREQKNLNFYMSSRIEARYEQLKEILREEQKALGLE